MPQLAPGNPCGGRHNCPGHVGLQHTRLDRDEIAADAGSRGQVWLQKRHETSLRSNPFGSVALHWALWPTTLAISGRK
jgi:hypothetical protein